MTFEVLQQSTRIGLGFAIITMYTYISVLILNDRLHKNYT